MHNPRKYTPTQPSAETVGEGLYARILVEE